MCLRKLAHKSVTVERIIPQQFNWLIDGVYTIKRMTMYRFFYLFVGLAFNLAYSESLAQAIDLGILGVVLNTDTVSDFVIIEEADNPEFGVILSNSSSELAVMGEFIWEIDGQIQDTVQWADAGFNNEMLIETVELQLSN